MWKSLKIPKINKTGWLPDSYLIDNLPNINIVALTNQYARNKKQVCGDER